MKIARKSNAEQWHNGNGNPYDLNIHGGVNHENN